MAYKSFSVGVLLEFSAWRGRYGLKLRAQSARRKASLDAGLHQSLWFEALWKEGVSRHSFQVQEMPGACIRLMWVGGKWPGQSRFLPGRRREIELNT